MDGNEPYLNGQSGLPSVKSAEFCRAYQLGGSDI